MAVNKPVLLLEFLDNLDEEARKKRDDWVRNNLKTADLRDESGQANDVLTFIFLDDGTTRVPPFGAKVAVSVGYQELNDGTAQGTNNIYSIGQFSVNKVLKHKTTKERYIEVQCTTISHLDQMKTVRNRNFYGQTLQQVATTIAVESGLAIVVHPDVKDKVVKKAQTTESNQSFLRQVCDDFDAAFKVIGSSILIYPRGAESSVSGKIQEITVLNMDADTFTYKFELSAGTTLTGVRVKYRTPNGDNILTTTVGNPNGITGELALVYDSLADAQERGYAKLNQNGGNKSTLHLTSDGSIAFFPDKKIQAKTIDVDLNGKIFKIKSVSYQMEKGQLSVSCECEQNGSAKSTKQEDIYATDEEELTDTDEIIDEEESIDEDDNL